MRGAYVYILASKSGVLYVGVTSSLGSRVRHHRLKTNARSFSARYNVSRLVHWEEFGDIRHAIRREKEIKGWSRAKRVALIESGNPTWRDVSEGIHD
jgi:putative endonuclease